MKCWMVALATTLLLSIGAASAQTPSINGGQLIGPPPAPESAQAAADRLAMGADVSPERLAQARADLAFDPWRAFQPVFGESFSDTRLPRTAALLATVTSALAAPINGAKETYSRARPFATDRNLLRCDDPGPDANTSGSYPSGHGAAGWAWALALAETSPARADAILARGHAFGESRIICGYHFPSDIEASRIIAAGVIARMHGEASFRRQIEAARREQARAYPSE